MYPRYCEGIFVIDWSMRKQLRVGRFMFDDLRTLRATWILILVTISSSMLIHALSGHARDIPFFISESDFPGLERVVFTLGLTAAGLMLCVLAIRLSANFESSTKPGALRISRISGLITGLALALLSWFNMHDQIVLHSIFALTTFGGGYIWACSAHAALAGSQTTGHKHRKYWIGIAGASLLVMNLALAKPIKSFVIDGNIRDVASFLDMAQASINIAAPAEYLLFFSLLMMLASFEHDLKVARANHQD
mgnify:CR=1 FL=1|jgi:hypothetical protein